MAIRPELPTGVSPVLPFRCFCSWRLLVARFLLLWSHSSLLRVIILLGLVRGVQSPQLLQLWSQELGFNIHSFLHFNSELVILHLLLSGRSVMEIKMNWARRKHKMRNIKLFLKLNLAPLDSIFICTVLITSKANEWDNYIFKFYTSCGDSWVFRLFHDIIIFLIWCVIEVIWQFKFVQSCFIAFHRWVST